MRCLQEEVQRNIVEPPCLITQERVARRQVILRKEQTGCWGAGACGPGCACVSLGNSAPRIPLGHNMVPSALCKFALRTYCGAGRKNTVRTMDREPGESRHGRVRGKMQFKLIKKGQSQGKQLETNGGRLLPREVLENRPGDHWRSPRDLSGSNCEACGCSSPLGRWVSKRYAGCHGSGVQKMMIYAWRTTGALLDRGGATRGRAEYSKARVQGQWHGPQEGRLPRARFHGTVSGIIQRIEGSPTEWRPKARGRRTCGS